MEKKWYFLFNGKREGPYSIIDLKQDLRITPDTLVWREGFENWMPIRDLPELDEIFAEEEEIGQDGEEEKAKELSDEYLQNEIVLDYQKDPYPILIWLAITILIMIYVFYQLFWNR